MDAKSELPPPLVMDSTSLWSIYGSLVTDEWISHLTLTFLVILALRIIRAMGLADQVYRLFIFVCTVATPSGRKMRQDRLNKLNELFQLREQLKQLNMVDQFAKYSRVERRIKALVRELDLNTPNSMATSIYRRLGINVALVIIQGIVTSCLVLKCPKSTWTNLEPIIDPDSLFLSKFSWLLEYIPAQLVVMIWISLCFSASSIIVPWFERLWCALRQSYSPCLQNDDKAPCAT